MPNEEQKLTEGQERFIKFATGTVKILIYAPYNMEDFNKASKLLENLNNDIEKNGNKAFEKENKELNELIGILKTYTKIEIVDGFISDIYGQKVEENDHNTNSDQVNIVEEQKVPPPPPSNPHPDDKDDEITPPLPEDDDEIPPPPPEDKEFPFELTEDQEDAIQDVNTQNRKLEKPDKDIASLLSIFQENLQNGVSIEAQDKNLIFLLKNKIFECYRNEKEVTDFFNLMREPLITTTPDSEEAHEVKEQKKQVLGEPSLLSNPPPKLNNNNISPEKNKTSGPNEEGKPKVSESSVGEKKQISESLVNDIKELVAIMEKEEKEFKNNTKKEPKDILDKVVDLNKRIINQLESLNNYELPSSLTQQLILQWLEYSIKIINADEGKNTNEWAKKLANGISKNLLDRIFLGGESKEYTNNIAMLEKFISNFPLGGSVVGRYGRDLYSFDLKNIANPFAFIRIKIHDYLTNTVSTHQNKNILDNEQYVRIRTLHDKWIEGLKKKWENVRQYTNLVVGGHKDSHDKNEAGIKRNINELMYVNFKGDNTYTDITSQYSTFTDFKKAYDELKDDDPEMTKYQNLMRQVEITSFSYLTIGKKIDERFRNNTRQQIYKTIPNTSEYKEIINEYKTFEEFKMANDKLRKDDPDKDKYERLISHIENNIEDFEGKMVPVDAKKAMESTLTTYAPNINYNSTFNAILPIFLKTMPLPDFVTRDDLLQLFIIDPTKLTNKDIDFENNESLLNRIGDIDEFIRLLRLQVSKLNKIGIMVGDGIERGDEFHPEAGVIPKLISAKKKIEEKKASKIAEYNKILDELNEEKREVKTFTTQAEQKLLYQTQMHDIHLLLRKCEDPEKNKLVRLGVTEIEYKELVDYLILTADQVKELKGSQLEAILPILNTQMIKLQYQYNKLKQMEKTLKSHYYLDQNETLIRVQDNLKNIATAIDKIDHIKKQAVNFKYPEDELKYEPKFIKKTNKLSSDRTGQVVVEEKKQSKKGLALYALIMTRKNLSEGNLTREYLNKLYSNPIAMEYLSRKTADTETIKIRNELAQLEEQLVEETAKQLAIASREAFASSDRRYFTINPITNKREMEVDTTNPPPYVKFESSLSSIIKEDILNCKTNIEKTKMVEHWIKVMLRAYDKNDQFTPGVIMGALTSSPIYRLIDDKDSNPYIKIDAELRHKFNEMKGYNSTSSDLRKEGIKTIIDQNNDVLNPLIPYPLIFTSKFALLKKGMDEHAVKLFDSFGQYHDSLQKYSAIQSPFLSKIKNNLTSSTEEELMQKSEKLLAPKHIKPTAPKQPAQMEEKKVEPITPEQELHEKQEESKRLLVKVINEFYKTEKDFINDMGELQGRIQSLKAKNYNDKIDNSTFENLKNQLAEDYVKCAIPLFQPLEIQDTDLANLIDNLDKIATLFESKEFSETLNARQLATAASEWSNKFDVRIGLSELQLQGYEATAQSELIKPTQRIPRYSLLLKEMIAKAKSLQRQISDDNELNRISTVIKKLEDQLTVIENKTTKYNDNDSFLAVTLRMIAYDLTLNHSKNTKHSSKIQAAVKELRQYPALNISKIANLLDILGKDTRIDTSGYLVQLYDSEFARLNRIITNVSTELNTGEIANDQDKRFNKLEANSKSSNSKDLDQYIKNRTIDSITALNDQIKAEENIFSPRKEELELNANLLNHLENIKTALSKPDIDVEKSIKAIGVLENQINEMKNENRNPSLIKKLKHISSTLEMIKSKFLEPAKQAIEHKDPKKKEEKINIEDISSVKPQAENQDISATQIPLHPKNILDEGQNDEADIGGIHPDLYEKQVKKEEEDEENRKADEMEREIYAEHAQLDAEIKKEEARILRENEWKMEVDRRVNESMGRYDPEQAEKAKKAVEENRAPEEKAKKEEEEKRAAQEMDNVNMNVSENHPPVQDLKHSNGNKEEKRERENPDMADEDEQEQEQEPEPVPIEWKVAEDNSEMKNDGLESLLSEDEVSEIDDWFKNNEGTGPTVDKLNSYIQTKIKNFTKSDNQRNVEMIHLLQLITRDDDKEKYAADYLKEMLNTLNKEPYTEFRNTIYTYTKKITDDTFERIQTVKLADDDKNSGYQAQNMLLKEHLSDYLNAVKQEWDVHTPAESRVYTAKQHDDFRKQQLDYTISKLKLSNSLDETDKILKEIQNELGKSKSTPNAGVGARIVGYVRSKRTKGLPERTAKISKQIETIRSKFEASFNMERQATADAEEQLRREIENIEQQKKRDEFENWLDDKLTKQIDKSLSGVSYLGQHLAFIVEENTLKKGGINELKKIASLSRTIANLNHLKDGQNLADVANKINSDLKNDGQDSQYCINIISKYSKAITRDIIKDITEQHNNAIETKNDVAMNTLKYLNALKTQWEMAEIAGEYKGSSLTYRQEREKLLTAAITEIEKKDVTISLIDQTMDTLQKRLPKAEVDADVSNETENAIKSIRDNYISPALERSKIEAWLNRKIDEKPTPDENPVSLEQLGKYIAYHINVKIHENKIHENKNHGDILGNVITPLREMDQSDNEDYIIATIQELKNHSIQNTSNFTKFVLQHAEAQTRDTQEKVIADKDPQTIIQKISEAKKVQDGNGIESKNNENPLDQHYNNRIINYLEALKNEWNIAKKIGVFQHQQLNHDHNENRIGLISDTITQLNQPNLTLNKLKDILNEFQSNLDTANQIYDGDLTKETGQVRETINNICEHYLDPAIKFKEAEAKKKAHEERVAPMRNLLDGSKKILSKLFGNLATSQPKFTSATLKDYVVDPETMNVITTGLKDSENDKIFSDDTTLHNLTFIKKEEIDRFENDKPGAIENKKEIAYVRDLPNMTAVTYEITEGKAEKAQIKAEHVSGIVKMSAKVTDSYNTLSDADKVAADLEIADALVRQWVAKCGNDDRMPVPIRDTGNESRVRALIIVCKAHELKFIPPPRHSYNFDKPKPLDESVKELHDKIASGVPPRIGMKILLGNEQKHDGQKDEIILQLEKLQAEFEDLQGNPQQADAKEITKCEENIRRIKELVNQAKIGRLDSTKAVEAIKGLNESLEGLKYKENKADSEPVQITRRRSIGS